LMAHLDQRPTLFQGGLALVLVHLVIREGGLGAGGRAAALVGVGHGAATVLVEVHGAVVLLAGAHVAAGVGAARWRSQTTAPRSQGAAILQGGDMGTVIAALTLGGVGHVIGSDWIGQFQTLL